MILQVRCPSPPTPGRSGLPYGHFFSGSGLVYHPLRPAIFLGFLVPPWIWSCHSKPPQGVSRVVTCCTYFSHDLWCDALYKYFRMLEGRYMFFFFPFFAWFWVIRPSLEGLFSPLGSGYTYKYPLQLSMPGHPRCLPTSYPPDSESRGVEGKNTFITCDFLQKQHVVLCMQFIEEIQADTHTHSLLPKIVFFSTL